MRFPPATRLAAASPWRPRIAPKPPAEEPAAASAEPDRTGPAGGYRLSGIVQAASGRSVFDFGRDHIFALIGMSTMTWSSDPAGHTIGGWGIGATVREYARFSYLYLKNGAWNGRRSSSRRGSAGR